MGKGWSFSEIESMRAGARTTVHVCMNIRVHDRVLFICDEETTPIARLLLEAAANQGARVACAYLEEYGRRPITEFPAALRERLQSFRPTVTFYTAQAWPGEVPLRIGLHEFLIESLHARHAHMIGITPQLLREGMAVDYRKVAEVTAMVYEQACGAHEAHVLSPLGTDLTVRFNRDWRWVKADGIYHKPGQWGNLPDGEVFTAPLEVNGVFAAEVLGDFFSRKYGVLQKPVLFHIENGLVIKITNAGRTLRHELEAYLHSGENSQRVGEFAVGTNVGLQKLCGNMLQDEKFPGAHIAFGNPYPELTGADWSAQTHMDAVTTGCTITLDDEVIMRNGRFDYDVLGSRLP